jgi:hypothetical protein
MLVTTGYAVVLGGLGLWLALSIANQYQHGRAIYGIKRRDDYSLIPVWTFFAPQPFTQDLDILYRDRCHDGIVGGWRLVPIEERSLHHLVWNPYCRMSKALVDVCTDLLQSLSSEPAVDVALLPSFRVLRLFTAQLPSQPTVIDRQFAIVRSHGYRHRFPEGLQILVLSDFAPLPVR